jgi:hypothetical protein
MIGCTTVSRGTVIVSDGQSVSLTNGMEDAVAGIVDTVVERYGLKKNWQLEKHVGAPCTMERSCTWSPAPWLFPWTSVFRAADGRIHVDIERRHVLHDKQVEEMTHEIAKELRKRFGSERVSIDIGY